MDTRTGKVYPSEDEALRAGVPTRDIVMVQGSVEAIRRLSRRLASHNKDKAQARTAARRKKAWQQQRASRARNRK